MLAATPSPRRRRSRHAARLALLFLCLLATAGILHAQQPPKELQELRETSQGFYRAGDYAQALHFAERALPLVIRTYGPDHEQTGLQYYSLGLTAERSEEHTSELQSLRQLVCRLLLEKK